MMAELASCGHECIWHGLYRRDYDLATPESISHPAKASWDLAFRILEHLGEMGLLKPGATILDPMAGTSRFGLSAMVKGFASVNVELEPKFVLYSLRNFEYNLGRFCICGESESGGYLRWLWEAISRLEAKHPQESIGKDTNIALHSGEQSNVHPAVAQGKEKEPENPGANISIGTETITGIESELEGGRLDREGLPLCNEKPWPGNSGTSLGDGAKAGSGLTTNGKSSSSERGQIGQSPGESDANGSWTSRTLAQLKRQSAKSSLPKVCEACGKPTTPFPIIIQGDARNLSGLLAERGLVAVSSPPYGIEAPNLNASELDGPIGNRSREREGRPPGDPLLAITSPPYGDIGIVPGNQTVRKNGLSKTYGPIEDYGSTPGQIGNLPDKPIAITSPPYLDSSMETGEGGFRPPHDSTNFTSKGYGDTPGQIANLPNRPLTAITSPPGFDSLAHNKKPSKITINRGLFGKQYGERTSRGMGGDRRNATTEALNEKTNIGLIPTVGNKGREMPEYYLSAMRQVYAEIAKVADVLVVVTKNPTRNGKLRRLDLDTIALLEATGWRIHCQHQAMLFEEQEQAHLFDGSQKQAKGRMSFFKRLAWRKGSLVAKWEDVIVLVKE